MTTSAELGEGTHGQPGTAIDRHIRGMRGSQRPWWLLLQGSFHAKGASLIYRAARYVNSPGQAFQRQLQLSAHSQLDRWLALHNRRRRLLRATHSHSIEE